jgi:hypothetical protein
MEPELPDPDLSNKVHLSVNGKLMLLCAVYMGLRTANCPFPEKAEIPSLIAPKLSRYILT